MYKLYNPQAATRFLLNIVQEISTLNYLPYRCSTYDEQTRFLIYKNFIIIYEIQEKEKTINILRIKHKKQIRG